MLGVDEDRVATGDGELSVLFIDLEKSKAVDDAVGHQGGDRLPRTVAQRLQASVRTGDTVALDPAPIALSASVGIAIRRPGQREREAIRREADATMDRAKVERGITVRGSL